MQQTVSSDPDQTAATGQTNQATHTTLFCAVRASPSAILIGVQIGGSSVLSKAECSWQKVIAWLGYSKAADVADGPSWSAVIERLQQPGQLDEVLQRATEPVEFGHHEFTAAADDEQSLVHLRPPRELPEALSMNTSPHPTAARASRWASGF